MKGAPPVRRILLLAAVAQCMLLLCAARHPFFWGGAFAEWLHLAETLGLLAAAAIGAFAYVRALRATELAGQREWMLGAVALAAIATLAPTFLSNDVRDHIAHCRG